MAITDILTFSSAAKRVIGPLGTLDTVAANTPAYDYSSGRRRLLIEAAQATNILSRGRSPGATGWTVRGTATVATGIADPTGGTDATRVMVGLPGNDTYLAVYTGAAAERREPSVWLRRVSTNGVLRLANPVAAGLWQVDLTLVGTGWTRITRSHPAVTVLTEYVSSAGSGSGHHYYASSGELTVDLWGAQLEVGIVSTSTIPTDDLAVTRIADDVRLSAAALAQVTWAGGCTIALRGSAYGADWLLGGAVNSAIAFSGGVYRSDGGETVTVPGLSSAMGSFGLALACAPSSRSGSCNGGAVAASGANALWGLLDETAIRLGADTTGGSATKQLFIDELVIWPFVGSDVGIQSQARVYA